MVINVHFKGIIYYFLVILQAYVRIYIFKCALLEIESACLLKIWIHAVYFWAFKNKKKGLATCNYSVKHE